MAWTKFKSLGEEHNEQALAIRYEGFYHDMNHRDLGLSLNKCLEIYNDYCDNDQKSLFDIAYIYAGMGHIKLVACDLNNHLLFERPDGGSNGYDREDNYQRSLAYNSKVFINLKKDSLRQKF